MQARETTTSNGNRLLQSDLLLALHIAVPVAVVDVIGGGVPLSALSIFSVPFYDWASVLCAVWALLVLNRKSKSRGIKRCR
jgi:hypothetical protein